MRPHGAADAEVVGVDHLPVHLGLLALEADVGNPVLAAAIRAAGDVELQVLLEAGQPRLDIVHEVAPEALGLRESHLAALAARGRHGAPPEGRTLDTNAH